MDFIKKVLVLKQITAGYALNGRSVSGIVRLETESGVCSLHLSLINLAIKEQGEFYLFIIDCKDKIYSFELGKRPTTFSLSLPVLPDLSEGVQTGVCYIEDDIPELVAYACLDRKGKSVTDFKKRITERCLNGRKTLKKKEETQDANLPQTSTQRGIFEQKVTEQQVYDDEVVATENYYVNDQDLAEKLKIIERFDNGNVPNEIDQSDCRDQNQTKKEQANLDELLYEKDLGEGQSFAKTNPYYASVRRELDNIFNKFPQEPALARTVDKSKWARINYSNTQYYVVGVVYENDLEKYICYGVPAKYSPEPPKELKGFCSFIPLSVFDMQGDGYWMMFQDAVTGECVKIND